MSKYGSQFQDNGQHDALEFLLWLLDRVHEDLEGSSQGPGAEKVGHSWNTALCFEAPVYPGSCVHKAVPCSFLLAL